MRQLAAFSGRIIFQVVYMIVVSRLSSHLFFTGNSFSLDCKKSNFRKLLLTNVKKLPEQRIFSRRSRLNFLRERNKNTQSMSLEKVVLLTLLRYSSMCSQHIQMFFQLFKLSLLNKQFYIEQYCTSSQHALQLLIS